VEACASWPRASDTDAAVAAGRVGPSAGRPGVGPGVGLLAVGNTVGVAEAMPAPVGPATPSDT
jgi:hypothetical protein